MLLSSLLIDYFPHPKTNPLTSLHFLSMVIKITKIYGKFIFEQMNWFFFFLKKRELLSKKVSLST